MFIRNESFYTFRRNYPVVTTIIAIHLILFIWMNFLPGGRWLTTFGIGFNPAIAQGEFWRLLTPVLMHIGVGHVLFNSFSLVLFGPALERMLGKFKFIIAYFTSGIIANLATFYIGGLNYPPHLGASGAIFGLFGIYLYMVLLRKDLIDQANSQVVMTILVIGLIMTFVNTNINIFAHMFGLIGGALLAPIILVKAQPYNYYQYRSDPGEVSFNPNRWRRKRIHPGKLQKIIWIAFGLLVLLGLIARIT